MKQSPAFARFSAFDLSKSLLTAIDKIGYSVPTEVQQSAIPAILEGSDVIAGAETGSGKTAAFALPLLEKLIQQRDREGPFAAKGNHVKGLILVPTRELALQVSAEFEQFSQDMYPVVKCLAAFGGVSINPQMMALRGGVDILVSTPGRLLDLVDHNAIKFNKLETLVIDEVDRLVAPAFREEIERILKMLPNERQNLMFTATLPDSIRELVRRVLVEPVIINIEESEEVLIDQRVITVNRDKKTALLADLLNSHDWKQVLIFCSAKRTCNNLAGKLATRGIAAVAMHSDIAQKKRIDAMRDFKAGDIRVLIATDVASRGIDIEQLPCVINFELPRSPNDYIHRIGRTGRAGEVGLAISLIAHHEYQHFQVIEKRCDVKLERVQVEGFEADEVAPPPPARAQPKKKTKVKLSKKKLKALKEKQNVEKKREQLKPLVKRKPKSRDEDDDYDDDDDDEIIEVSKPQRAAKPAADSVGETRSRWSSDTRKRLAESDSTAKAKADSPWGGRKTAGSSDAKAPKGGDSPWKNKSSSDDKRGPKDKSGDSPWKARGGNQSSEKKDADKGPYASRTLASDSTPANSHTENAASAWQSRTRKRSTSSNPAAKQESRTGGAEGRKPSRDFEKSKSSPDRSKPSAGKKPSAADIWGKKS